MTTDHAMGDRLHLESSDGTPLVLHRYPAQGTPRAALLFSPALGMRANFYPFFARALAAIGIAVWVNEQRGHGEHPHRASRRCDFGYRELVEHDLATASAQLRMLHPGLPLIVGGHSLGGQLSALFAAAHPERVDALLLIASGTTHFRNFSPSTSAQVLLGSQLLFGPAGALAGYYPGHWFGFGGREARRLMRDWSRLARTNRFVLHGSPRDYERLLRAVHKPILSITVEHDPFAPPAAARALTSKMPGGRLTEVQLPAITPRRHPSNHALWAREPDAVTRAIEAWLPALGHPTA